MHSTAQQSFRVVLTGGIASGKSAVADRFAALGIPIIDTDRIARDVVEPGTPALAQIAAAFGSGILDDSGRMDRSRMRALVFSNPELRKKLESIQHPAIGAELARLSMEAHGPYQIHAIPLFVEGGAKGNYDRVLVVDCPEELQLQRLLLRDSVSETQARQTLAAQASRDQRLAVANDVIVNDGSIEALDEQVDRLHKVYLGLAAEKSGH